MNKSARHSAHAKAAHSLEERLEVEINAQEKILNLLMSVANKVEGHCDSSFLPEEEQAGVSPEAYSVLSLLVSCVIKRLDELCDEINVLSAQNEQLETQIGTYSLERDMLSKDMEQLTFLNNALRKEKLGLENDCSKKHIDTNDELAKEVEELREKNRKLQTELTSSKVQINHLQLSKDQIASLEATIISNQFDAETTRNRFENKIAGLQEENSTLKRLTEQLKGKIRDLGSRSGADAKDFLDSFEEVMQEEMMAMKAGFESKLKVAKAESDELARRHANEIKSLSLTASPSAKSIYNPGKYSTKGV